MITLKEKSTDKWLGSITEAQLQFLIDELEEEHRNDQDYWINTTTLDAMKERGAEPSLVKLLEDAMHDKGEIEFYWNKS